MASELSAYRTSRSSSCGCSRFVRFAKSCFATARQLYAHDAMGVDLGESLYALDSTVIDLCLALFPWARLRRRKGAVRLHPVGDICERVEHPEPPAQETSPCALTMQAWDEPRPICFLILAERLVIGYPEIMSQALEQALELIRKNRPDSLERALALLQNTVYSFSMKVCGHPQDAEDTMQDVLLKSIPYLAKFDTPQALTVWLYKVARNRCISSHRRSNVSRTRNLSLDELMPNSRELQDLLQSAGPNPEAALLNSETAEHLRLAVLNIPSQYRMVLVLHDMEDLTTTEVAQIMGLREGTVRVRLHRARLLVRQHLAKLSKAGRRPGLQLHASAEAARSQRCRRLFAALSDYMDGIADDAMCEEIDLHLHDCEPCQAFLSSLKNAVAQCRSYAPRCDSKRAQQLRRDLLLKYQQAVTALAGTNPVKGARNSLGS